MSRIILVVLTLLILSTAADAEDNTALIAEHVYGGMPSSENLFVRTAYVVDYDPAHKAPRWVAYHLTEDYRRTPKRIGKWKSYRADPDVTGEPKEADYSGTFDDSTRNYARGHLAPFMICGGDRDGDGKILDADKDGKVEARGRRGRGAYRQADQLPHQPYVAAS